MSDTAGIGRQARAQDMDFVLYPSPAIGEKMEIPQKEGAMMESRTTIAEDQAADVASRIGIDFDEMGFDLEQFRRGMEVELEHGLIDLETNVTNDDPDQTGKIAWAHLNEFADYYDRLDAMEAEARRYWADRER